jgi:hypothetical protein
VTGGKEVSDLYELAKTGNWGPRQPGSVLSRQFFDGGIQSLNGTSVIGGSSGLRFRSPQLVVGNAAVVVPTPGKYELVIGDTAQATFPINVS